MTTRIDLYTRVTNALIADLEKGVRPWLKPWNAEHAAGRITRPLRAGGQPYKGINVLMLWAAAMTQNFTAPIWMTFNQAKELKGNVRKDSNLLSARLGLEFPEFPAAFLVRDRKPSTSPAIADSPQPHSGTYLGRNSDALRGIHSESAR